VCCDQHHHRIRCDLLLFNLKVISGHASLVFDRELENTLWRQQPPVQGNWLPLLGSRGLGHAVVVGSAHTCLGILNGLHTCANIIRTGDATTRWPMATAIHTHTTKVAAQLWAKNAAHGPECHAWSGRKTICRQPHFLYLRYTLGGEHIVATECALQYKRPAGASITTGRYYHLNLQIHTVQGRCACKGKNRHPWQCWLCSSRAIDNTHNSLLGGRGKARGRAVQNSSSSSRTSSEGVCLQIGQQVAV